MFKQFSNLFSPDDANGAGSGPLSKDDIIDFLGEEDEKEIIPLDTDKEKKDDDKELETKDDDGEAEKESVEDELEEELEEPSEEKLELVAPASRKEILTKYPKLFREFPYLEKAMYREQQFTALLPTLDDAKNAIEARDTLGKVESDLMNGDTEKLLLATKSNNGTAFNKLVDNYLDTLAKVDEKAYVHVIGNTIKHTIIQMATEGKRSNNERLLAAAQILNQFVFGSSDFAPPERLSREEKPDTAKQEIARERQEFTKQRFELANGDIHTRVNNSFKATIEANIDPKQSMTDYNRKNAVRDALEQLETSINGDTRFRQLVDKLWEAAVKNGFNKESTDRIRSAFLSKGKTLLPNVIKKARNEALKGMGKRVSNDEDNNDKVETTPVKRGRSSELPHSNNKSGIPAGMSTLEYLMKD